MAATVDTGNRLESWMLRRIQSREPDCDIRTLLLRVRLVTPLATSAVYVVSTWAAILAMWLTRRSAVAGVSLFAALAFLFLSLVPLARVFREIADWVRGVGPYRKGFLS